MGEGILEHEKGCLNNKKTFKPKGVIREGKLKNQVFDITLQQYISMA